MNREDCVALDERDPLAVHRRAFALPANVIYLDGNSLGALPRTTGARVREVVEREWGEGLIRSWNARALDRRAAAGRRQDRAPDRRPAARSDLRGLDVGQPVQGPGHRAAAAGLATSGVAPERRVILSERGNFPTDLYVAQGVASLLDDGHELKLVEPRDVARSIDERTAVVMLTHVNFRSGAMHDLAAVSRAGARGAVH